MRSLLSLLTAAAAALVITATAEASAAVKVHMTIHNGLTTSWPVDTLDAQLASGTRVGRVTGGRATVRHGRVTIKPGGTRAMAPGAERELTITIRGTATRAWSYAAQSCRVKRARRVVRCTVRAGHVRASGAFFVTAPSSRA